MTIEAAPRQLEPGLPAERQVVGICLRYPQAEPGPISRLDFTTPWLGRLFDACKMVPAAPAPPDTDKPPLDVAMAQGTPMPPEWREWLEDVWDWRPRHAAKLAQVRVSYACALYDECASLGTLGRWAGELVRDAALRRYRALCAHVVDEIDSGQADVEEIKAVLTGVG